MSSKSKVAAVSKKPKVAVKKTSVAPKTAKKGSAKPKSVAQKTAGKKGMYDQAIEELQKVAAIESNTAKVH